VKTTGVGVIHELPYFRTLIVGKRHCLFLCVSGLLPARIEHGKALPHIAVRKPLLQYKSPNRSYNVVPMVGDGRGRLMTYGFRLQSF